MTPERAAEVLGVSVDASPADVERAFHRRARATHPDVVRDAAPDSDAGAAFREALQARDALLRLRAAPARVFVDDLDRGGRPIPRVQSVRLMAVWAGLIAVAAFLAIVQAAQPLSLAEPLVRWGVLLVSALAYAATGRRVFLVLAIVAELASLTVTVLFASFGGLVALLITLPALLGAFTGGLARERVRRLATR
ncbi:MAG: J domain-containing protein [Micrococcales bacterium]|nr:J domain-containing protein [Micrococcales bacterium]